MFLLAVVGEHPQACAVIHREGGAELPAMSVADRVERLPAVFRIGVAGKAEGVFVVAARGDGDNMGEAARVAAPAADPRVEPEGQGGVAAWIEVGDVHPFAATGVGVGRKIEAEAGFADQPLDQSEAERGTAVAVVEVVLDHPKLSARDSFQRYESAAE